MKKFGKVFVTVYLALCVVFSIWFCASWIDIVADNCDPNPVHSDYNLFVMMTENRG